MRSCRSATTADTSNAKHVVLLDGRHSAQHCDRVAQDASQDLMQCDWNSVHQPILTPGGPTAKTRSGPLLTDHFAI